MYMKFLYLHLNNKFKNIVLNGNITFIVFILLSGAFLPIAKQQFIGEKTGFENILTFKAAGKYLKQLNCECSTVTTDEHEAGIVIFSETGIPGASYNIYYFVDQNNLKFKKLTFEEIQGSFLSGNKITDLWILEDWILGGQYYLGRHAKLIFDSKFNDHNVIRVIKDYKEKYYIHDLNLKPNTYYNSIYDVKNKVYANPVISIYDMKRGRL